MHTYVSPPLTHMCMYEGGSERIYLHVPVGLVYSDVCMWSECTFLSILTAITQAAAEAQQEAQQEAEVRVGAAHALALKRAAVVAKVEAARCAQART